MTDFTTVAGYFGQDLYWSESNASFLIPSEMPFQQAFYSHRKLMRENFSAYEGSVLYEAFIKVLCPAPSTIRYQLERYGKACHALHEPGGWAKATETRKVRKKMYDAAKYWPGSRKVKTHIVTTSAGQYLEATIVTSAVIKVKGKAL